MKECKFTKSGIKLMYFNEFFILFFYVTWCYNFVKTFSNSNNGEMYKFKEKM
jgi:hypothetical protein